MMQVIGIVLLVLLGVSADSTAPARCIESAKRNAVDSIGLCADSHRRVDTFVVGCTAPE